MMIMIFAVRLLSLVTALHVFAFIYGGCLLLTLSGRARLERCAAPPVPGAYLTVALLVAPCLLCCCLRCEWGGGP